MARTPLAQTICLSGCQPDNLGRLYGPGPGIHDHVAKRGRAADNRHSLPTLLRDHTLDDSLRRRGGRLEFRRRVGPHRKEQPRGDGADGECRNKPLVRSPLTDSSPEAGQDKVEKQRTSSETGVGTQFFRQCLDLRDITGPHVLGVEEHVPTASVPHYIAPAKRRRPRRAMRSDSLSRSLRKADPSAVIR
jgi:hypothetical protein